MSRGDESKPVAPRPDPAASAEAPIPRAPEAPEDTEADAPGSAPRRRGGARPPSGVEVAPPEPASPRPAESFYGPRSPLPAGSVRLVTARLRSAAARAALIEARATHDPAAPPVERSEAPGAELALARSTDRRLRLVRVARDGLRLFGTADGRDRVGARSTVAVGVDGRMWRVELHPGMAPIEAARALESALARGHRCEVVDEGRAAFVRVLA